MVASNRPASTARRGRPRAPAVARVADRDLAAKQVTLLRTTYRLIGRKGMHRLTLQDVADDAGVSKAVIIYYFKTKEELVLLTMRWVLDQVAARVTAAIDGAAGPEAKVAAMVDAIFIEPGRNRDFYRAYTDLIAHGTRNNRFLELSAVFRSIVNGQYAAVIRTGLGSGFHVEDVDEAASAVRAIVDGLFLQWLEEPDWRAAHPEYKARCARGILRYLGADA